MGLLHKNELNGTRSAVTRVAWVATAAAVLNASVYAIGRVAGARFMVRSQDEAIGVEWVIIETIVAVVVGSVVTLAARRGSMALGRIVFALSVGVAAASCLGPILYGIGGPTKALLTGMHLIAGAAYVSIVFSAVTDWTAAGVVSCFRRQSLRSG